MNKNELISFFTEKPGYLKKGNDVIKTALEKKGFTTSNISNLTLSKIKRNLRQLGLKKQGKTVKPVQARRLFFDIETSYNIVKSWRIGWKINLNHNDVIHERAIICISYKWEGEDKVHTLKWDNGCDKQLVTEFVKVMNSADELIGHNVDKYDIKFVRTRALFHGIQTLPKYVSYDTLKHARKHFSLNSNRLDAIARLLGLGGKLKHAGMPMWDDIVLNAIFGYGSKKAAKKSLKKMIKYCEKDVTLTEEVYNKLRVHTERNTHHGVLNGKDRLTCVSCGEDDLKLIKTQVTKMGTIKRLMECKTCGERFFMSNTNYLKLIK